MWVKGYTAAQLDDAQARYGVVFPPDLVALYRERRPELTYDWASRDERPIREAMAWPLKGFLFDVEHNVLWLRSWGEKPKRKEGRAEIVRAALERVPKLIPLYGHRYIPQDPHESGNPILSVYQSDIIYYGADLLDYFSNEFDRTRIPRGPSRKPKHIPFWSDFAEGELPD